MIKSVQCPSKETLEFSVQPLIFICVGSGPISRIIQQVSDDIPGLPNIEKASHIAIGGLDLNGDIKVFESHMKTNGPRQKSFEEFIEINKNSEITAYPYPFLEISRAELLCSLGLRYGMRDIVSNRIASWSRDIASLRPDYPGVICSELACKSERHGFIRDKVRSWRKMQGKVPSQLIQPSHYHRFFLESKAKGVKVI